MWSWAAVAFNLMHAEAKKAGIKLQNIGDYRPYSEQLAMFNDRYMDKETGRVPTVTRKWQGKTWYLKKGKSPSGVPGTSNHGLGLAMDINVQDGKVGKWLCENAPKYGFYLQGSDPKSPEFELWHWQYCVGDKVPQPVQELMAALAAMKK
jgi:LAS superfamily LD-carboxypeptidase LdcB